MIAPIPGSWLIGGLVASLAGVAVLLLCAGLSIDPLNRADRAIVIGGIMLIAGLVALRAPRSAGQRIARDALEYVGAFTAVCLLGAIASYPVAAVSHGFADAKLERVDRLLRFDWLSWYDLVSAHPLLQRLGAIAYQSIFATPALLFATFAWQGRRAEARRFIAAFWVAAVLTLILFAFAPAEGPLAFLWRGPIPYMPASALYQAQLIPVLRNHALHSIAITSIHGLVCSPSFHTTSAVLYMLGAWSVRRLRVPVILLNILMLLATPVEGTHYLTDMIMGALVALVAWALLLRGTSIGIALPRRAAGYAP